MCYLLGLALRHFIASVKEVSFNVPQCSEVSEQIYLTHGVQHQAASRGGEEKCIHPAYLGIKSLLSGR